MCIESGFAISAFSAIFFIRTNPVVTLALRIEIINAFQLNAGFLLCTFAGSRYHQIKIVSLISCRLMVEFKSKCCHLSESIKVCTAQDTTNKSYVQFYVQKSYFFLH